MFHGNSESALAIEEVKTGVTTGRITEELTDEELGLVADGILPTAGNGFGFKAHISVEVYLRNSNTQ